MKKTDRLQKITYIIFLVILAVYPLRHIWLGVELTDGAYSAGNYRFSEQINGMWLFATYLANSIGGFLTGLPWGNCLMGLRFYTALFVSATALMLYFFFTKVVKAEKWLVFLGEMLAVSLCWCPTTILYNYLTYFFFHLGIVFLYLALVKENRLLMFLAGVSLGLNVMVRFPNLTEAALILSVWYYGYLQWKRIKDVVQETLLCILGYLAGAGAVLLSIVMKYGLQEYAAGITRLLAMPSDAEDYSLYSMVLTVLLDYKASSRWLLCMAALVLVGLLLSAIAYRISEKTKKKIPRAAGWMGSLLFLGSILFMFRWWYALGVFNVRYYTYESMFQWVAVFLILSLLLCFYRIFSKKSSRNEKLLASMVLILIAVTPLGSNNHLYPNMNNMFLVFPFTLSAFWKLLKTMWEKKTFMLRGISMSVCPAGMMLAVFLLAMCFQSLLFGAVFTFRDGMSGQIRDTKIEKNVILKGMVTNRKLAEAIEGLTLYVEEEGLQDREVLLYGQIPGVSYILDMPSAISTTWPDLRSYGYEVMEEDMQLLTEKGEQGRPLVIVEAGLDSWLQGDGAAQLTQKERESYAADKKLLLIIEYMDKFGYERVFSNTRFAVYR